MSVIFTYLGFFFKEHISISSIKIHTDFSQFWLCLDHVWRLGNIPCLKYTTTIHRTPELVCVTQTGSRTTDAGGQKSSLNKRSLLCSVTVISLSNTITACKINVPTGDVVSAVVFIVFAARKVTTY